MYKIKGCTKVQITKQNESNILK